MKKDVKFINTEKIEGYVYSTGSSFNELQERVTGENSKNPGTKYIAGDLDIAVDEAGLHVEIVKLIERAVQLHVERVGARTWRKHEVGAAEDTCRVDFLGRLQVVIVAEGASRAQF